MEERIKPSRAQRADWESRLIIGDLQMIKIYMDNCCFNRPYDNQEQVRIRIESEAKLEIQARVISGEYLLVWSFMLDYENSRNNDYFKQIEIAWWADVASDYFIGSSQTSSIADELMILGIKSKDAVHLACAIETRCDYFLTTDDGILKKKDQINSIIVINPIDFIILREVQQ